MIGVGVFLVPAPVARSVPDGTAILALWIAAGLVSFFGALAYAELGAMFPASGGQYVYLREAYGPLAGFLAGWAFFLVIQSGALATVCVGGSMYLSRLLPGVPYITWWAPLVIIGVLSWVNYIGVRASARVQLVFTVLKLSGLALIIVSAFSGSQPLTATSANWNPTMSATAAGFLGAFVAYDGWHVIAFVAGEVKDPERILPRSLAIGVAVVMAVYVLANVAYLRILGLADLTATQQPAAESMSRVFGPGGATLITLTIVMSVIGAANGSVLTAPRIYFAQARDGLFFRRMGDIHPRFLTPHVSIVVQGVWASLLALSGSYETLFSYTMFIAWAVHAATMLGLILLRYRRPDIPRPYKVWGYPIVPALFCAFALWLLVNTWVAKPWSSLMGALILAAGVPIYYVWRKRAA